MSKFIYTGEEYINVDHVVTIDTIPGSNEVWIQLDTGMKLSRKAEHLKEFLEVIRTATVNTNC